MAKEKGNDITYEVYHGTSRTNANVIVKQGFKITHNEEHWLGYVAYFYLEIDLAEYWARNQHQNFGTKSSTMDPAILKACLRVTPSSVIDMRILGDYNDLKKMYREFFNECKEALTKHGLIGEIKSQNTANKLRCAFFNWVNQNYEVEVVIGTFQKKSKYIIYNDDKTEQMWDTMRTPFIEVQVCVFDPKLITDICVLERE